MTHRHWHWKCKVLMHLNRWDHPKPNRIEKGMKDQLPGLMLKRLHTLENKCKQLTCPVQPQTRRSRGIRPCLGRNLARIRAHVTVDTIPEECELNQSSGEFGNSNSQDKVTPLYSADLNAEAIQGVEGGSQPAAPAVHDFLGDSLDAPFWGCPNSQGSPARWFRLGMSTDVRRLLRTCEVCQSAKHGTMAHRGHRQYLSAGKPWQVLSTDLAGPFTSNKKENTTIL